METPDVANALLLGERDLRPGIALNATRDVTFHPRSSRSRAALVARRDRRHEGRG